MKRRTFIAGLGSAAAWPVVAQAQQGERVRRVGVLISGYTEADPEAQARFAAFAQGLANLGWVEGRNLRLDVRWAGGLDVAHRQSAARELVMFAPDVILVQGTPATQALRDATRTIPIVFVNLADPVDTGIVSNLARPEANVTGFMIYEPSMAGKWLSLLKDMAPRLARVALLFNPDTAPYASYVRASLEAGERLALKIAAAGVRDAAEIEGAVAAMAGSDDGGLLVLPDVFNVANSATTTALAAKYRVPAIYSSRQHVATGGLMAYGADQPHQFRDGATYVDRILRGTKPADLPVEGPTKFHLVINLKTAKALGLTIPETLLATADEVIQ
jgi:putative ABC transport system substrate-binding protein